jgi:DNA-binding MarR family transcriptional regulator/ribosomal protein S18 acetylase RimI-like enzyme
MMTSPPSQPNPSDPISTTEDDEQKSFYLFRLLQSLRQSIRAIDLHSNQLANDHKITSPQLICLNEVQGHPKISISEVSRLVHLSPSTVIGILDRLEDKNLIRKIKDDADKREIYIAITQKGTALLADMPAPFQEEFSAAFSALPSEQQHTIVQSFEQVVDLMKASNIDAAPMLETGPLDYAPEVKQALWATAEVAQQKNVDKVQPTQQHVLDIRPAKDGDQQVVADFINSSTEWYRSLVNADDMSEHEVGINWANENFKKREFFIGYENDVPVGTVTMQTFGDYTYLGYVYIDTNHVGKAYGKQLLDFAKKKSMERNLKGMVLIAHPKATWAIKAYQKYGFELFMREKSDILAWNNGALKPYFEDYFMLFLYPLTAKGDQ